MEKQEGASFYYTSDNFHKEPNLTPGYRFSATTLTCTNTESWFGITVPHEEIVRDHNLPEATNLCVMCDKPATQTCLQVFEEHYKIITPRDVPVNKMNRFVFVAYYSLKGMCLPEEVNRSLASLTKGLTRLVHGPVLIAALSWSYDRVPYLNLEDVTGRDIVLALDYLKRDLEGVCNPDPSRVDLPSTAGIKITDLNNPFFERLYGPEHNIENMKSVQVLKSKAEIYCGRGKPYGCTLPFLLGLPWIITDDIDRCWSMEKKKIETPTNFRFLNFQFDPENETRRLENIRVSKHEDFQEGPCRYGSFLLVRLLGAPIHPYHVMALCDYLDSCHKSTTTPSKEEFLAYWGSWCQTNGKDGDGIRSPYDTGDASTANLWGA
ncbi:hypothetical protein B0T20DRAFT_350274 [Sordaria brevicollis]|uniref:Uncharacterized protein n=1 Tax=Sordaria brevicollis TaxID=83679 RepID=A0AAE0PI29_SORBR|nr:hypothetical protein B0T20DRAFT_350274 [Sordaria brevicollis]